MPDERPLTLEEFNERLVIHARYCMDHSLDFEARRALFRREVEGKRVLLFKNSPSTVTVMEDGIVALKIRVACERCKVERPNKPRRTTVYVGQNDMGDWTVAMLSNGDEIADLRTDKFYCGEHAKQILSGKGGAST